MLSFAECVQLILAYHYWVCIAREDHRLRRSSLGLGNAKLWQIREVRGKNVSLKTGGGKLRIHFLKYKLTISV
jgi:hypothetical protein